MHIETIFTKLRLLQAVLAAFMMTFLIHGCSRGTLLKEQPLYVGPITDAKLKEACLRQAEQFMAVLLEEGSIIPDMRGKEPEKIELDHAFETYPFQTFTIHWPMLTLTLRTDGGLVELQRPTPPSPPATTHTQLNDSNMMGQPGFEPLGKMNAVMKSQPHVTPKQSITTETAHRLCQSLVKRLMPLTCQQFNKMRWTRPEEEMLRRDGTYAMTGYINFLGTVNGLPCDDRSVYFKLNYTGRELEYISIRDIPGIYPSVQDQKISAEEGARIAMEYLGKEYGKKTQMETILHTLKLSCVDRPDGGPSPLKQEINFRHPRLVHWYKICSRSLPPDTRILGFLDDVTVDAISGIVLDHGHYRVVGASADVNYRNFVYKRFPDKE